MNVASRVLKNISTGDDNNTYDAAKILWIVGCISFMVYSGYDLYQNKRFDSVGYGTGLGLVLAGGGLGVRMQGNNPSQIITPPNTEI